MGASLAAPAIQPVLAQGANRRSQLDALLVTLYQSGPWNDNRPFRYDLDDPLGKNRTNKLLATYLATRKGNCVSMPILLTILGQRLRLFMTLATAPEHVLVEFVDDESRWLNIEATAGGFKFDSSYERETGITPTAIQNEIYLRPLSPHETVGVMASTLMEHYTAKKQGDALLAVAELALTANPKDTVAMIQKATSRSNRR
nr:transglutaminase family protein [Xanthomonas hyacinthi]